MHGVLSAVAMAAVGMGGGAYSLPCHSPGSLVSRELQAGNDDVYEQTLLTKRDMRLGGPASLKPHLARQLGPEDPQSERNAKGFVMRRLGLLELEGEGHSRCRMRFERAKNLEFRVRFDMDNPAFGIAYVTRY